MDEFRLIAPCHFGLESVLKREIVSLGFEIDSVQDGRVTFRGKNDAVPRANIFLRTAERVLVSVGEFDAFTFEELYQGTKALPWEDILPKNARFWVKKASSVKSKLFSPSDIQSIVKKAMVDRLSEKHGISIFPEDGDEYPLRVFINKDRVTVGLDSTGVSLHKRGYRKKQGAAPIAENLAAALIMLTPWKKDRILIDPFCGSGTFLTEAAMIAANMAPGRNREFTAEAWDHLIDRRLWYRAADEAEALINTDIDCDIQGYDIDAGVIRVARENAVNAGVSELIHFQERPVRELSHSGRYGFIITNPPYGERLEEKEALKRIYSELGEAFKKLDSWSLYVITSYDDAEKYIGKKAGKNRKIYNGMIQTRFFIFEGPKPPRRTGDKVRGQQA
ncbi:MAG: class I SAM-dependent RNA methyltransferase [Lachnospiraceae bacterium]|nr:class I SAM-dependent RNA methyltransferase [Lachnospiraceae bacterium]